MVAVAAIVAAMFYVAKGARLVADSVREGIAAPGPPVTTESLRRVMGDVPLPPFFTLDERATNDPALRLQVSMMLQRGEGEWILVFRSSQPYPVAAAWYQRHLPGWHAWEPGGRRSRRRKREREENGVHQMSWDRNGDRVLLLEMPGRPGELLLFVSTPPPRSPAARRRPPGASG